MEIYFEVNGRRTGINGIKGEIEKVVFSQVREHILNSLEGICDPTTGKKPTIIVKGDSLDKLSFEVEGSPEIVEQIQRALQ